MDEKTISTAKKKKSCIQMHKTCLYLTEYNPQHFHEITCVTWGMNGLYSPNHSLQPEQSMWSTEACIVAFCGCICIAKRIATTSNSSIVGILQCHLDCSLALFLVCSRSGSSAASLCLQLSAFLEGFFIVMIFLEGFFIVMILLLGSGYTLIKCYEPEIKKIFLNVHTNCHHSLLIMW